MKLDIWLYFEKQSGKFRFQYNRTSIKSWLRGHVMGLFGALSVFGCHIKGMIRLRPEQVWTCSMTLVTRSRAPFTLSRYGVTLRGNVTSVDPTLVCATPWSSGVSFRVLNTGPKQWSHKPHHYHSTCFLVLPHEQNEILHHNIEPSREKLTRNINSRQWQFAIILTVWGPL